MNALCVGCVWAQDCGGKTFCPFVEGSCVRVKGTMDKPDTLSVDLAAAMARGRIYKNMIEEEKKNESK